MAIEWKLVPMHPTEEMIQATLDTGLYHDGEEAARAVLIDEYKAMVKAAPPAPQAASEPVAGLSGGAEREALTDEQIDAFVPGAAIQDSFSLPQVRHAIRAALTKAETSATASASVGDAEREALTGFTVQEVIDACDAAGIDDREFRRLMSALKVKAQATTEFDVEMDQALSERDEREEVINAILDEVLGLDRHEWSSAYGFADAIEDVKTRMWALTRPPAPEEAKDAARLEALKTSRKYVLGAYEWTFPHEDENEATLRSVDEAIAALESAFTVSSWTGR